MSEIIIHRNFFFVKYERKIFMYTDFTLDDLLKCNKFVPYESKETDLSYDKMMNFLKRNITDQNVSNEIESLASAFGNMNFDDGFKQGFYFAAKAIKFFMKI